jgi:hypothetical protein
VVAVCIAFAAAGLSLLAAKLARRRLPALGVLGIAAAAVVASLTWIRYGWADQMRSSLPAEVRVIREVKTRSLLEPWTYVAPRVTAMVAIDDSKTLRHPGHPGVVMVTLIHAERYAETLSLRVLVDCPRERYAALDRPPDFDASLPEDIGWQAGAEAKDLLAASCGAAAKTASR